MKWPRKFILHFLCPDCGAKLRRVPFSLGESFFLEVLFYIFLAIAFVFIGFFVQGFGGSASTAFFIALISVSLFAIPMHSRLSSYRCQSCDKNFEYSEVKSDM